MIFNNNKEKFFFYDFPGVIFALIPFFLITGPFLSDLAISIIGILFLVYCWRYNYFSFFNKNYFYIFVFFWLYLTLNSLFNNFNFNSLKISFFYLRYGVFIIAILAMLSFNDKFLKNFFYCILICFIFLIIDGYYQYFFQKNLLGWPGADRISSFFGSEKILGSYLSRLWPILFGLSIFFLKKIDKLYFLVIVIFILSETLIFLSGERAAFFYINLSAIFIIVLSKNLLKLRLLTLISSIVIIILIVPFNPAAKERMIDRTLKQMNILNLFGPEKLNQNENNLYLFSKQHTHHYITGYKIFLDNKSFGVGIKNFRNFCSNPNYKISRLSCSTHPHNTYVQILSETGIIGFLFLIFSLIYFCFHILKHIHLRFKNKQYFNDFEICILSGILIYIWPLAPTGNIFNNWLNIILTLYFPLLLWSRKLNQKITLKKSTKS